MNPDHDLFIPVIRPCPPALSAHTRELLQIEDSGIFSNFGPVNARLEHSFIESMFGTGETLTVCNATIGLMLAIRAVTENQPQREARYALMPSFTFAAAAHAVMWCGLTPLFCDVDPETWLPDPASELALLKKYAGKIALILPCATFGNNLDLERYEALARAYDLPVVVDAAASMGSLDRYGRAFGSGFEWPIVFSMHATKLFSVGEGGLIYCQNTDLLKRLRMMSSFGFGKTRSAEVLGLNGKISEVTALTALLKLRGLEVSLAENEQIASWYKQLLDGRFRTQLRCGKRQAQTFMSVLLPEDVSTCRPRIIETMRSLHVGTAAYFSPHLAEQPLFAKSAPRTHLACTEEISVRILNLPMFSGMSIEDVTKVCAALTVAVQQAQSALPDEPAEPWPAALPPSDTAFRRLNE